MKKYLIAVLCLCGLMSCGKVTRDEIKAEIEAEISMKCSIIEIDSCEYVYADNRVYGGYHVTTLTHKGNCKNHSK